MAKNFDINRIQSLAMKNAVKSKAQMPMRNAVSRVASPKTSREDVNEVKAFGGSFHNPYTFIPFPDQNPGRKSSSLLTVDENPETGKRYTGVLNLKVKTVSPLLTMDCENRLEEGNHFKYKALTIGDDVIVPATSIRGSLRSLMTILSGGTLGCMDPNLWLCQNRDLSMNVAGKNGAKRTKLAEVSSAGDIRRDGSVCLGITRMISIGDLNELIGQFGETLAQELHMGDSFKAKELNFWRPEKGAPIHYLYTNEERTTLSLSYSSETPWKIKLSGKRIPHNITENFPPVDETLLKKLAGEKNLYLENAKEIWVDNPSEITSINVGRADRMHPRYFCKYNKKKECYYWCTYGLEAMFLKSKPEEKEVLKSSMWADFSGQNAHGVHPNLIEGDLVWLELNESDEIQSIQWSRWGRGGDNSARFQDALAKTSKNGDRKFLIPDSMNDDGKVDMVTDMFGMVPDKNLQKGSSFAARVRCHNLVFKSALESGLEKNVQLAPLAQPHAGCVTFYRSDDGKRLNGYKVYRNSAEGETPWLYSEQGLFDDQGASMTDFMKQTQAKKIVELLKDGQEGNLKVSFRALSEKELALLVMCCKVDWKLGGGKSLGLGHCKVTKIEAINENGDVIDLGILPNLDNLQQRVEMYEKSQIPVENMRYPRAVDVSNRKSVQRNGLEWFKRHANVNTKRYRQKLPPITAEDQHLYGYDLKNGWNRNDPLESFTPGSNTFDPHGPNNSPNRESNIRSKQDRNDSYKRKC